MIFLGINDCGRTDAEDLEPIVEAVLDGVDDLYTKAGARNFVLVDIPPIDHSPQAADSGSMDKIEERVKAWNIILKRGTAEFATSTKPATTVLFSSYRVLMEVLEEPCEFDFNEDDPTTEGGGIWADDLHLTCKELYSLNISVLGAHKNKMANALIVALTTVFL